MLTYFHKNHEMTKIDNHIYLVVSGFLVGGFRDHRAAIRHITQYKINQNRRIIMSHHSALTNQQRGEIWS